MKILRPEVESSIVNGGSLYDMFDNVIKVLFNITDKEYDFIAEHATPEELDVFVAALGTDMMSSTFGERRKALELRNKMLEKIKAKKDE